MTTIQIFQVALRARVVAFSLRFVLIIPLLVFGAVGYAQDKTISLSARNQPIKEVLEQIYQLSGYSILYSDEVVKDDLRVSVDAEKLPVKQLLEIILQNSGLTYMIQSDDIIVIKQDDTKLSENKITGAVVNEKGEPIPFVNVVQLSLPDSTFINGVCTGVNGRFSLDRTDSNPTLIEITYLGYECKHVETTQNALGVIELYPSSVMLGEVEVTASRPLHKMEADGLRTTVHNSVLSKLGTANDVLTQLPFVQGQDGNFTVFNRGVPQIYLNNRLLRNMGELRQLKSSDIKDVKVILTPSSRYDANIGAVIHITTLKPMGEGLSGQLYGYMFQRRLFSHYEFANLNYRKEKWDIFGTLSFNSAHRTQNQTDRNILFLDKQYKTETINKQISHDGVITGDVGFNYAFSPEHLLGIRYTYSGIPLSSYEIPITINHYVDDVRDATFDGNDVRKKLLNQHYVNTYYHKEFGNDVLLHFEGDIAKGNQSSDQLYELENTDNWQKTVVENHNKSNYSLYATKLFVEMPLLDGIITLGSDASFTDNKHSSNMLNKELSDDLPSNSNTSIQHSVAGYTTYIRTWNKLQMNARLRYEYINFEYRLNEERVDEQSKIYRNLFPSLSLSYGNMSLSYRTTITRPNYFNLRNGISYNNPYAYEGGNPSLLPMFRHKLTYLFKWKDLSGEISYHWIKDKLIHVGKQFKDKPISLFSMINLPQSQRLVASLNYAPRIGKWRPSFSIGMNKQNLTYEGKTYNKPYVTYDWKNIIELPHSILLSVGMNGNLEGNSDLLLIKSGFRTNIQISKRFLDNKLYTALSAQDIFGTDLERWSMHTTNRKFTKWNDGDNRGIFFIMSYNFNTTRSKYKGQGAANEERNRL